MTLLHPDRLFPADPATRTVARTLYERVATLPIISPHGHTDPRWFAENLPFPDPTTLLVKPDHYIFRMLHAHGVPLASLGIGEQADPRDAWRVFANHYHLFRGTPTRLWLDWVFENVFGFDIRLTADTADAYFDIIAERLTQPECRPRALFDRFGIEVLATTESPIDPLVAHRSIRESGWDGRVITTFRPDPVVDPDDDGFAANLDILGEMTGEDTMTYRGYLAALRNRRAAFRDAGATATDHGHPTSNTADLTMSEAQSLFARIRSGVSVSALDAETFRAHMLTVFAGMGIDDGMVMQLHPGSFRNHNAALFATLGRDIGADIPMRTDYVRGLKPLLDRHGNDARLTLIVFTLDESTYSRELAPLAGHYPALRLGPAWWFHDSPEGMRRFREMTTETAGFCNTVGFNDDTRAFLSIPARHDVARRVDCAFLARLICEHRIDESEAHALAHDLAYGLAKAAYRL